jgi:hypothetical protein
MNVHRFTTAVAACAIAAGPANALLSINVAQDDTTVPGWVVNTFTLDCDQDLLSMVALSDLTSGSMLNLPGVWPDTFSNGPGDSYYSINNDPNTNGGLAPGDLGGYPGFFDENGIGMTWYNIGRSDIGIGLHLATLTFSEDTFGSLGFITYAGDGYVEGTFDINDGIADLVQSYVSEPEPDPDPDPGNDPDPVTTPDPGTTPDPPPPTPIPYPNPGSSAVPEPVGLGVLGAFVAIIGGLHRRRLDHTD